MLIDDDEWIRGSLSLYFKNEGYHLKAIETAEDALWILTVEDYDIFIIDYKLPGIDGLEFLRQLKDNNKKKLKILITAYGNEELMKAASKLGVQEIIEKPFTSKTIEESLARLI